MKICLDSVQETLLLPLWSRAKLSREGNSILNDPMAVEIVENLDYDFERLDKNLPPYGNLMNLVRAKMFDDTIKNFILGHPKAVVVNLGCGLDTTFYRVDNGLIHWYDVDLPDVIEIRKQLIPETNRSLCIAQSIFDMEWVKEVNPIPDGIIFFCGGVLSYFSEKVVKQFFSNMADHFPGSEMVFNTISELGKIFTNQVIKNTGMKSASLHSADHIGNKIRKWDKRIEVLEQYPMFSRIKREDSWGESTISMLNLIDKYEIANIVHLRFLDTST
ncbi:MAG: class I SAM-dependent methyltransferase [Candidatus Freyarchaeum deiterrae]